MYLHVLSAPLISYQWLPPVAILRVCQGWIQENSYLKRRGSRVERGVRAYSPAWSEPPTRNSVARVGMRKRGLQRLTLRVGTGKRTRELLIGNGGDL